MASHHAHAAQSHRAGSRGWLVPLPLQAREPSLGPQTGEHDFTLYSVTSHGRHCQAICPGQSHPALEPLKPSTTHRSPAKHRSRHLEMIRGNLRILTNRHMFQRSMRSCRSESLNATLLVCEGYVRMGYPFARTKYGVLVKYCEATRQRGNQRPLSWDRNLSPRRSVPLRCVLQTGASFPVKHRRRPQTPATDADHRRQPHTRVCLERSNDGRANGLEFIRDCQPGSRLALRHRRILKSGLTSIQYHARFGGSVSRVNNPEQPSVHLMPRRPCRFIVGLYIHYVEVDRLDAADNPDLDVGVCAITVQRSVQGLEGLHITTNIILHTGVMHGGAGPRSRTKTANHDLAGNVQAFMVRSWSWYGVVDRASHPASPETPACSVAAGVTHKHTTEYARPNTPPNAQPLPLHHLRRYHIPGTRRHQIAAVLPGRAGIPSRRRPPRLAM